MMKHLALVWLVILSCLQSGAAESVLFRKKSAFNTVLVTQEGACRILKFQTPTGFVEESRCEVGRPWYLTHGYLQLELLGLTMAPKLDDLLVVGLGGGALSNQLARALPKARVDSLELDPVVVEAAQKFFGYLQDKLRHAYVGDARAHLEHSRQLYDVIFLDAFDGLEIPDTLRTRQFYQLVHAHLKPQGVAVTNLHQRSALYASDRNTLAAVFQHCYAFQGTAQAVVVCQDGEARAPDWIVERALHLRQHLALPYPLEKLARTLLPNSGWDQAAPILEDLKN